MQCSLVLYDEWQVPSGTDVFDGRVMVVEAPPALRALVITGFGPVVLALCKLSVSSPKTFEQVLLNVAVSFLGFLLTKKLIPILKPICLRRGLFGKDINKKGEGSCLVAISFLGKGIHSLMPE